ncbi:hypothetical protein ACIB24_14325 [Spongisporangium articulatum]|uniref:DUF559 domain-containing protein n=1 Tax=Spongisporangium articulatum TaxID=3362603 RepID=A0ABW8APG8_9ACTN
MTPRDEIHVGAVGNQGGVLQRRAWLTGDEICRRERVRLTTPLRTVVDCCRHLDDGWALAVADAAARFHGVTGEELTHHILGAAPGPGRARVTWVADHLDARSESALESLNRAVLIQAGFQPEPQVWISTDRTRYRVDLLDRANRVISEADGRRKYEQEEQPATPWEDKLRQDSLWDSGFEIVRFTMADYYSRRAAYLARYRRAVLRADQRSVPRLWG